MRIFELPLNSVSFGYIGYNILNELYSRRYNDFILRDIGPVSLESFDKKRNDDDFIAWLNDRRNNFLQRYKKSYPSIKLWHINNSEGSISAKESLWTFVEVDQLTQSEVNVLNQKERVFVTSNFQKETFENYGVEVPVVVVPIGLDPLHFYQTKDREKISKDVIAFSLFGKMEKRKSIEQVLRTWIRLYGNNGQYLLNVHCYNVHLSPEDNNRLLLNALEGKPKPFNVNFLPYYSTLGELNQCYNWTDIVIDMSKAEGFSLPSHCCVAMGKHAIVHYNTGMMEWANEENSVLVYPNGKEPAVDGIFFSGQGDYNVGNWHTYSEDDFVAGLERVVERYKKNSVNVAGLKLTEKFNWKNCVDALLA